MYRRAVVPIVAIAAILAIGFVVPVGGATGIPRSEERVFFRDGAITSPVHGNVQVYGASLDVEDVIDGDLLVFGGKVTFSGRGQVKGNLIYAGGRIVNGTDRIGGETYPLASVQGAAAAIT